MDTPFGAVLVDPLGRTIYASLADVDGVPTCDDGCAENWQPVPGDLAVDPDLWRIGFDVTGPPADGGQLRIGNRWPLYTFGGDREPGEINGQGRNDLWYAMGPDGNPVGTPPTALAPTPPATAPLSTTSPAATANPATANTATPNTATPNTALAGAEPEPTELPPHVRSTAAGDVLVDDLGRSLYIFSRDLPGASVCGDPCSTTWPPLEPATATVLLSTPDLDVRQFLRTDGVEQVTLNGHALYRFVDDTETLPIEGQGEGNVWFLLDARGAVILPPSIRVGTTDAGDVLVDPRGFVIHTAVADGHGRSVCDAACLQMWAPVPGDARLHPLLDEAEFSTLTRADGASQMTHRDHALYTFTGDDNAGDRGGLEADPSGGHPVVGADRVSVATIVGLPQMMVTAPLAELTDEVTG